MSSARHAVPIIIAGAGPTGLTLSNLLSQLGVRSLLLERAPALRQHPQAHYINNRTMEVFRQMRLPDGAVNVAASVSKLSPPLRDWRKFIYCESMTGNILGEVDHFQGQTEPRMQNLSPEPVAHLSQHRLLPVLLKSATAPDALGEVQFGHAVRKVKSMPNGKVYMTVAEVKHDRSYEVECDYLVAADGANSSLRSMLGVNMIGRHAIQHLVNIHFMASGLEEHLRGREAMLYFVFNSEVISVLVAHDLKLGEFVAQVPFFPPVQSLADFSEDVCKRLLLSAIGKPGVDLQVLSVRTWSMHAEVAERMKAGNVLFAGDAAHRFPPAGGFGMNTGIQDAHNLAWKLAAVIKGEAGHDLLDTYEAERRAIAIANTELSVSNWKEALKVPQALGLDPAAANALQRAVTSRPASILPSGLVKSALEMGLSLGRVASGVKGPLRPWRERLLRDIFAAGGTLRLQFPREDLGYIYDAPGAAVYYRCGASVGGEQTAAPGRAIRSLSTGGEQLINQQRGRPYVPTTLPGARLPHCEIEVLRSHSIADAGQQHFSTLDLMPYQSTLMHLLLSGGQESSQWAEAAELLQEQNVPVRVVHICQNREEAQPLLNAGRSRHKQDRENVVAVDFSQKWQHLREVSDSGAILVRPDGHVAWRAICLPQQGSEKLAPAEHHAISNDASPFNILREAFNNILSKGEVDR